MKKQLFFLMLLAGSMLAFTGCSKDDDDVKSGDIQGRWDLVSQNYKWYEGGKLDDQETDTYDIGESYIVFSGNKASTFEDGQLSFVETFSISGNKIIFTADGRTFESTIAWKSNDQVVITNRDDDEPNSYEIVESTYNRNK